VKHDERNPPGKWRFPLALSAGNPKMGALRIVVDPQNKGASGPGHILILALPGSLE
jgi:hypothetical protein